MRKKIVAGKWKMNKTLETGIQLTSEIINLYNTEIKSATQVILAPPFIHLHAVAQLVNGIPSFSVAAQNCSNHSSGAFTGEISAEMVKSTGAKYVIIGHSERRMFFAEHNDWLARKADMILEQGLTPIYCCGETLEERNSGKLFDIIGQQIREGLFHLDATKIQKVVIAYEPVWAIGTGVTASTEQAQQMHEFIRNMLIEKYGIEIANEISILYGGSVKPDNAAELFSQPDIDGGLIGGASLQARSFVDIIKAMNAK